MAGLEPANHGKGPRVSTSKTVIPTTHTRTYTHIPLENGQCIFPFFSPSFPPPSATRCGGQGREGTRRVMAQGITRGTKAKHTHTCHPPSHPHAYTISHDTTHKHAQHAGWSALQIDRGFYGFRPDWVFCFCRVPPPLPGNLCMLHVQSLDLSFSLLLSCSGNVFFQHPPVSSSFCRILRLGTLFLPGRPVCQYGVLSTFYFRFRPRFRGLFTIAPF